MGGDSSRPQFPFHQPLSDPGPGALHRRENPSSPATFLTCRKPWPLRQSSSGRQASNGWTHSEFGVRIPPLWSTQTRVTLSPAGLGMALRTGWCDSDYFPNFVGSAVHSCKSIISENVLSRSLKEPVPRSSAQGWRRE